MKEETKLYMSQLMIQLEKQLSDNEQDSWADGLSDRERKGIEVERKEILSEIKKVRKCFIWLCDLKEE